MAERESRFKGTRGVQTNDVGETMIVDEIKDHVFAGKTVQQAVDAVSVARRMKMRDVQKIAARYNITDEK